MWAADCSERVPTDELRVALAHAVGHLENAAPRKLGPARRAPPVLVFIDGACEPEGTSIGAIMFCPGVQPQAFGAILNEETVCSFLEVYYRPNSSYRASRNLPYGISKVHLV